MAACGELHIFHALQTSSRICSLSAQILSEAGKLASSNCFKHMLVMWFQSAVIVPDL